VSARRCTVDVELNNGGPDHGGGASHETPEDFADRSEAVAQTLGQWIDPLCSNGNEDDESKRVKVVDDIIRNTIGRHGGGLRGQGC